MGIFRQFPYTNFHDMNLDQIISTVDNLVKEWFSYTQNLDAWKRDMDQAMKDLKAYVDGKFGDVADVVQQVLDEMYADGRLETMILNAYPDLMLITYKSAHYITFDNLMDIDYDSVYTLFDEYVTSGLLSKQTIGYATEPTPATGQGVANTDIPIYMYSWTRPAIDMRGFAFSRFNNPILLANAIHGNEKLGVPVMLTMLSDYVNGNPIVTKIFNEHDIDFIPVVNPYGFNEAIGTTIATVEQNIGRTNARGVDLNRNGFTYWQGTAENPGTENYKGVDVYSECETTALKTVYQAKNYAMIFDLHTWRYNTDTNIFALFFSSSLIARSIFSNTMEQLYQRITDYGFNIPAETNTVGITDDVTPSPQWFTDYNMSKNSDIFAYLLEFPRYNTIDGVKVIYPEVIQKISTDILVNYINNMMGIASQHEQNIAFCFEDMKKLQKYAGSIYPVLPSYMVYGTRNENNNYYNETRQRIMNNAPVKVGAGTWQVRLLNLTSYDIQTMSYYVNPNDTTEYVTTTWSSDVDRTPITISNPNITDLYVSLRMRPTPNDSWVNIDKNAYGRDFVILLIKTA